MNDNELHEYLIDYAEGNISPEKKIAIESFLINSPQLKNDLILIKTAFNGLQNIPEENVSAHYFSNFLPRLRQRLDSGNIRSSTIIPEWFRLAAAPSLVSLIIFSMVMMYQSFKPEDLRSPIYSMINDMERTEINSLVDETSDFEATVGIMHNAENLVGDISNVNAIESKLTEDLLVLDASSYQSEHELLSDMGDKEIEQVLDRLDKRSIE